METLMRPVNEWQHPVSVIVPFYKAGRYAQALVRSLASQTVLPGEVILIDDGRGEDFDELHKWLVHYQLLTLTKVVCTFGKVGPAQARNLGLALASGRLIAFLDADDTWDSSYLEKMFNFHRKTGAALMTAGVRFYSQGVLRTTVIYPTQLGLCQMLQTNSVHTPAIVIDRMQTGDFWFPICPHEDYALWLQFVLQGYKFQCLNQPLVNINRVDNSVSSNKNLAIRWHFSILKNLSGQNILVRIVLFGMYALNAILKRILKNYYPIFLPCFFLRDRNK
jgi:teichuronic acid biosynthesis glycosyltransferase TuaG